MGTPTDGASSLDGARFDDDAIARRAPTLRRVDIGIPTLEGLKRGEVGPVARQAMLASASVVRRQRPNGPPSLPPIDLSRLGVERTPEVLIQLDRAQAVAQQTIARATQAELRRAGVRNASELERLPPQEQAAVQQRVNAAAENAARSAIETALLELQQPIRERLEALVREWMEQSPTGAKIGLGATGIFALLASGQEVEHEVSFVENPNGLSLRASGGVSQSHARGAINLDVNVMTGLTWSTGVSGRVDVEGGVQAPTAASGVVSAQTGVRINFDGL